jgi:hypothetical protein
MNESWRVGLYPGSGKAAKVYSIWRGDSKDCELDKFLDDEEIEKHPDFYPFLAVLRELMDEDGFVVDEKRVRYESKKSNSVCAVAYGDLRLYILRWSNICIIAGGIGIKEVRTHQDDEALDAHVNYLIEVEKILDSYRKKQWLDIDGRTGELDGLMEYEP